MKSIEDSTRRAFGVLLRRYRLSAGLSQENLAERARISVATVSTLERGTRQVPHRETALLLAEALQLSADDRAELIAVAALPQRPRLRRFLGGRTEGVSALDALSGHGAVIALHALQAPRHNLPIQLSSLIGRDEVVADVRALVRAHRLVTLVGGGGVGKTRVALQVAEDLISTWPEGVRLVELAAAGDNALVVGAIAQALGVRESRKQCLLQTVIDSLKRRRLLLVLDNCEHVIDEVSRVAFSLLRECHGTHVLATSQEALKISGERTYRVLSLPYPAGLVASAADAIHYPAVALFVDRAQGSDITFNLSDENAKHVGDLCRRLDGIPLAIELAAARVNHLAPRHLASMLDDRFRMLTGRNRTAPSRQQTMEATLSWSYELLSTREQLLFDRLSVFADACALEMANAVCAGEGIEAADVLELLSSLVDKSLVVSEEVGDETRYRLLESSRQYGRDRLARRGETEMIAGRHAAAYLELADRFANLRPSVNSSGDLGRISTFLDAVEREQPEFSAAVAWSLGARGNVALGQRLASAKIWGSHIAEPLRWVQVALDASDSSTKTEMIAMLERRLGDHLEQRHEFDQALAARRRETAIWQELGDCSELAASQVNAAMILLRLGRVDEAECVAQLASTSADALVNRRLLALVRDTLGTVRLARGDYSGGRLFNIEALEVFQAERDGLRAAMCEINLAAHEFGLGNSSAALKHSAHALSVLRAWRHADLAECLSNEATFLTELDRYDEARQRAFESLSVALETVADAPTRAIHAIQRLAAVAALRPNEDPGDTREDHIVAARLLGYADARLTAQGAFRWPTDRRDVERAMASLAVAFGLDEVSELMRRGALMGDDEAIEFALRLALVRRERPCTANTDSILPT